MKGGEGEVREGEGRGGWRRGGEGRARVVKEGGESTQKRGGKEGQWG